MVQINECERKIDELFNHTKEMVPYVNGDFGKRLADTIAELEKQQKDQGANFPASELDSLIKGKSAREKLIPIIAEWVEERDTLSELRNNLLFTKGFVTLALGMCTAGRTMDDWDNTQDKIKWVINVIDTRYEERKERAKVVGEMAKNIWAENPDLIPEA